MLRSVVVLIIRAAILKRNAPNCKSYKSQGWYYYMNDELHAEKHGFEIERAEDFAFGPKTQIKQN